MDKNLRWQVLEEDAEITQKKYLMLWFEWDWMAWEWWGWRLFEQTVAADSCLARRGCWRDRFAPWLSQVAPGHVIYFICLIFKIILMFTGNEMYFLSAFSLSCLLSFVFWNLVHNWSDLHQTLLTFWAVCIHVSSSIIQCKQSNWILVHCNAFQHVKLPDDPLCGLVVRVPGFR
jgi:hypothetical protein